MSDVGIIKSIEDDSYQGKDFKKVTLVDGSVLKVKYGREGALKAKWGELQVGRSYSWVMGEYNGKPFVQDFNAVELPPPGTNPPPARPVESPDQGEIDDSYVPAPQEVGMWWKEVGTAITQRTLSDLVGKENCPAIICAYRTQMLKVTGLTNKVDSSKFPAYKSE